MIQNAGLKCFLFILVTGTFQALSAQVPATPLPPSSDAVEYENQQRALVLLNLEKEINTLPDVSIRVQLRFNILEFIYKSDVRTQFAAAETMVRTMFDEMAANEKAVTRQSYLRNQVLLLLREHDPATAKVLEAKYRIEVNTASQEAGALFHGSDPQAAADWCIKIIAAGKNVNYIYNVYDSLERNPDASYARRVLAAALDYGEKHPGVEANSLLYALVEQKLNATKLIHPPSVMLRYYRSLVAGVREPATVPDRYVSALWPVRRNLVRIQELDKQLYADARSIVDRYMKTRPPAERAKQEAVDRIEASDDKLAAAIAEAEKAASNEVSDYLWYYASQQAAILKKFEMAGKLLMRSGPELGTPGEPLRRDQMMASLAYRAALERHPETAKKFIDLIGDDLIRARVLIQLSTDLYRTEAGHRDEQVELSRRGLELLEKVTPDADSICWATNTRYYLQFTAPPPSASDIASRYVAIANRVPMPAQEPKVGTTEREDFLNKVLARPLLCVGHIFRPYYANGSSPDPSLVDLIKVTEWRLTARIEAEKSRKYSLPQ